MPESGQLVAATIARELLLQTESTPGLEVIPIHMFLPVPPSQSNELLIHTGPALAPNSLALDEGNRGQETLEAVLRTRCKQTPFRLPPESFSPFLADLRGLLVEDLGGQFSLRQSSERQMEGFGLSPFIVEMLHTLNEVHPGQLVAFREAVDSYREMKRRVALRQLEVEVSGAWSKSLVRRWAVWAESLVALPLAAFGLANHLLPWALGAWLGLLRRGFKNASAGEWTARALVTLVCYAGQIALVNRLGGRATAGYYALLLPLSGGYLFRYAWLLRNRTRLLVLGLGRASSAQKLERMRKLLIEELNTVRDRFAEARDIPHG